MTNSNFNFSNSQISRSFSSVLTSSRYRSLPVQYPQRYFLQFYPILSYVYAVPLCVYPILSFVNPVFPFKSLCIVRVSYVSCICNSLGSHVTFHYLYGKNQRCSRSVFRFVKKNHFTESIKRKYVAEFEGEEKFGENQNGDC